MSIPFLYFFKKILFLSFFDFCFIKNTIVVFLFSYSSKKTIGGFMKVKIGFLWILMLLCLLSNNFSIALPALLAATLHELGHIGMAKLCRISLGELKLGIFGAGLSPSQSISYPQEILLCVAGPAINFLTVFFLRAIGYSNTAFGGTLVLSSLALGSLNLLPIRGFDGGRIFGAFLCLIRSPTFSERVISILSYGLVFLLWSFSLYLLLRTSNSLSLFIFSLALFCKLFEISPNFQKSEGMGE